MQAEQVHQGNTARYAYDATIRDVARTEGQPIAEYLASGLEYPAGHLTFGDAGGYPYDLLAHPLALGLLGLAAAVWSARRRAARLGTATKQPAQRAA